MAEIDISSYPKPAAAPAQKTLLDQVGQYQTLESQGITISKQKLDMVNTQFGLMNAELSTLVNDPSITKEQAAKRLTTFAETYQFPPQVSQHMIAELDASPNVQTFAKTALTRGMATQEKVNNLYGNTGFNNNGQQITPTVTSPMINGGAPRASGAPIQIQNPPGMSVVNPDNPLGPTQTLGPQAPQLPVGAAPIRGGLPGQYQLPIAPTQPNFRSGLTTQTPNQVVQSRGIIPSGPITGPAPGEAEAKVAADTASGVQLADMRRKAAAYQRDIFPLNEAIPALEKLGSKGTGPGTDTINHLKSFVLSNIPGVKETDFGFGAVKDFDKAKKYLTDFVNQTGNSGTNDKLAAAFAGNPSVGISNAAAVDVAKSALALRKAQQAIYLQAEKANIPANQVSRWVAQKTNEVDPRAFGTDMMNVDTKKKLLEQLKKNPLELKRFEESAQLGVDLGIINRK